MTDLFSTYRPPAVYFDEVPSIAPTIVGIDPALVTIVGPSVGYRTYTEGPFEITTTNTRLAKLGIDTTSVTVRKVGASTDVASTEYTKTVGTGADASSADAAHKLDDTLDIKVSNAATGGEDGLTTGDLVTVSYRYTDASFYMPLLVQNYSSAADAFGEDFDADGNIQSPLTLAARLAFNNGATQVLLASTPAADTVDTDDLLAAYDRLVGTWDNADILVPLPVGITGSENSQGSTSTVASDLGNFLTSSESDGVYRTGIVGYETSVTVDPATFSEATANRRVDVAWPNSLSYYNPLTAQTIAISGYYLAAALAGRLCSQSPSEPLTRKTIVGFSGIPDLTLQTMSRSNKDAWSSAGVTVVEPTQARGLVVRHGVTTDTTSINTREISVVRARDAMVRLLRDQLDSSNIIGSKIVDTTGAALKSIVQGSLERLVDSEIIVGYSGLEVRQLTTDPSIMEVKYAYRPAYPLNYVLITFAVDTTTGVITETTGLAA